MKRVVIGLSGGVDSSVAAYLLKEQGYDVIGVFMKNWEEQDENGRCTSDEDFVDARQVAASLDIPFYAVNYAKEYWDRVFSYFLSEYKKGRTPNPDVLCNKEIKFKPFLQYARSIGADFISTGHYCDIKEVNCLKYLAKSKDLNKDQTYFLNQLSSEQISNVLFPLANILKPKVREIAQKLNLNTAEKKDSTGICFIGERNFRSFLKTYLPAISGKIMTKGKVIVGEHIGLMHYTIGQRKGLGIGGNKDFDGGRWFVVEKDLQNNILYVQQGDEKELMASKVTCNEFNFITEMPKENIFSCMAKFRYRQQDVAVNVTIKGDNSVQIVCDEPQRAITEGQFAVLYQGDICLGGGAIDKVEK